LDHGYRGSSHHGPARGAQGYTDNTGAAESVASSRRPHWSIAFNERYDRQYVLCLAALLNRPLLALLEP
jgi:hypothetical protein